MKPDRSRTSASSSIRGRSSAEAGAVEPPLEQQVLRPGGQLVGPAQLADVADALAHLLGVAVDVEAGHRGPAGVDGEQGREHPHGGGLAGSVRAEQPEDLSGSDLEAHAADGLHRSAAGREGLGELGR